MPNIRAFALRLLTTPSIEARLAPPPRALADDAPGPPLRLAAPVRPANLSPVPAGRARVPSLAGFANPAHRVRILHALANHELQAVELYAWALLAFPDAPPDLRRDLLSVLQDEQRHTRMYIARVQAHGARFGDFPVTDYFWAKTPFFLTPLRFLCAMALTWENANLDHTTESAAAARAAGDEASAAVIDKVHADEIRHVAIGWRWLARLREPGADMWEAWRANIDWPLRPALARGRRFHPTGRIAAGLDAAFIAALAAADVDVDVRGPELAAVRARAMARGRPPVPAPGMADPGSTDPGVSDPSVTAPGLIVANLDAEQDFEVSLGLAETAPAATAAARRRAGQLGRLLTVLGGPDDRMIGIGAPGTDPAPLWPGQPLPRSEASTGGAERGALQPHGPIIAWAETAAVEALRRTQRATQASRSVGGPAPAHRRTGDATVDALWGIPPPDALTAARCNHRRWGLDVARRMGVELPGTAWVVGRHEVEALCVGDGPTRRAALALGATACVVKAACSSAGRDRVWVPLSGGTDAAVAAQLDRLFERHGEAIIEPWVARCADFGAVGYVDVAGRPHTVGLHRQRVDQRGRFQGVDVPMAGASGASGDDDDGPLERSLGLRAGEAEALRRGHGRVGLELAAVGYRGAYGIDAWHWRDAGGLQHLHPLGEINARMSIGLLGRILVDRAVAAVGPARAVEVVAASGTVRVLPSG